MESKEIKTGKLARTLAGTGIAASASLKHLGYLSKKPFAADKQKLRDEYQETLGRALFHGLSQLRGTALKASQVLSMESDFIPERVRKELEQSCYKVPPINRAQMRKVFKEEFGCSPKQLFSQFDQEPFAAASLGQVHLAELENGRKVAVKVQYPGIKESIDSDLKIISTLCTTLAAASSAVPNRSVLNTAFDMIREQLLEEIDYEREADNTRWFQEHLIHPNITIPSVIENLSRMKIITFEFLNGLHVDGWLAKQPTQEERNRIGQIIFDTFLFTSFELKSIHADPHMGNYLFLENGDIGLLDFGCIKHLDHDFVDKIRKLYSALVNSDIESTITSYKSLNILAESIDTKTYLDEIKPGLEGLQQWTVEPFKVARYDFGQLKVPPKMTAQQQKKAVPHFNGFKRDQMYFDRNFAGIFQLLKKIGAVVKTENSWIT